MRGGCAREVLAEPSRSRALLRRSRPTSPNSDVSQLRAWVRMKCLVHRQASACPRWRRQHQSPWLPLLSGGAGSARSDVPWLSCPAFGATPAAEMQPIPTECIVCNPAASRAPLCGDDLQGSQLGCWVRGPFLREGFPSVKALGRGSPPKAARPWLPSAPSHPGKRLPLSLPPAVPVRGLGVLRPLSEQRRVLGKGHPSGAGRATSKARRLVRVRRSVGSPSRSLRAGGTALAPGPAPGFGGRRWLRPRVSLMPAPCPSRQAGTKPRGLPSQSVTGEESGKRLSSPRYLLELHGDGPMPSRASTPLFKTLSVYKIYIMYINQDVSLCELSIFSLRIKLFP